MQEATSEISQAMARVKRWQYISNSVIVLLILVEFAVLIYADHLEPEAKEQAFWVNGAILAASFLVIAISLFAAGLVLLRGIKYHNEQCQIFGSKTLSNEARTVVVLCIIFSISYATRFFMDIFFNTATVKEEEWFSFFLTNYLMLIIYDLIPIYLTVIIHYGNLSQSQPKEVEEYQYHQ